MDESWKKKPFNGLTDPLTKLVQDELTKRNELKKLLDPFGLFKR